jgi:hypothetical protein
MVDVWEAIKAVLIVVVVCATTLLFYNLLIRKAYKLTEVLIEKFEMDNLKSIQKLRVDNDQFISTQAGAQVGKFFGNRSHRIKFLDESAAELEYDFKSRHIKIRQNINIKISESNLVISELERSIEES